MFAGGGEEVHWGMSAQFDAMGALSTRYNEAPEAASRPYDADRDGFVIAGGGGMLVLEEYEHARARGARIHAELVGYGVTSDGADMVAPSGEGAVRCMEMALAGVDRPVGLPQHARHLHPGGRRRGAGGGAGGVWRSTARRSPRRRRSPATRWAPPACTRRSTAC